MADNDNSYQAQFVFESAYSSLMNRELPDDVTDPREIHAFHQDRKKQMARYAKTNPPGIVVIHEECKLPHANLEEEEIRQAALDFATQYRHEILGIPEVAKISFEQMIGDGYDFDKHQYGHSDRGLIIYNSGLACAIADPPYSVSYAGTKRPDDFPTFKAYEDYWYSDERWQDRAMAKGALVHNYLDYHLGTTHPDQADHLCIWKADDSWSDFFDMGKEWWGTYFYIVEDQRKNVLHIFAASTTD